MAENKTRVTQASAQATSPLLMTKAGARTARLWQS
jgi:hypothetical protein